MVTDINGHHRTRNGFTGLETDIKRIRMDTNGLKEVLSVTHPLARCDHNFKSRNKRTLLNSQVSGLKMIKLYLRLRRGSMYSLYGTCSERFKIKLCNISHAPRGRENHKILETIL